MPVLHSLCLSSPSSLSNNDVTLQMAGLSSKPSPSLNPPKTLTQTDHLPLPLPELPTQAKQKILSLEIMGIDSGRVLSLNPDLRTATPDSIQSVISYLLSRGIHFKDLGRIFGMCPKILTSSIHSDLSPVFSFLSRDLNVPDSNFRQTVNKCPRLLVSSVRHQLKPALIYLRRLGFNDVDALAYQDPVLLVSSVERTLMPKLEFLMGLGLSRDDAIGMVLRCPALFTFSVENNFKPKYDYFLREMGGSLEELKEFPQYFAFSLEKRIKPRHKAMVERALRLPLSVMLKSTDEEYKELMQLSGT